MLFVASILFVVLGPSPDLLGHPKYSVREWTELAYNPISAYLLPSNHVDPEIRERIHLIKRRLLRPYNPIYQEQVTFRDNPVYWLSAHLVNGDSLAWSRHETFMQMRFGPWIHDNALGSLRYLFLERYPFPFHYTSYMYGILLPGEFEWFERHVQYYDGRRKGLEAVVGGWSFMVVSKSR